MRAAALCVACFAAVTVAVQLGAFAGLDQWSIDHVMPWVAPASHSQPLLSGLLPFTRHTPRSEIPAAIWLYPASVPISALVTAGCCASLWRRGFRVPAAAWASAWILGNAIEVIGKETVLRPTPHVGLVHMPAFDDSFPSGHAIRALLLVALLTAIRPRLRVPAAVWLAIALPLLVVTNAHLPSDVIGAVFLGCGMSLVCARMTRDASRIGAVASAGSS